MKNSIIRSLALLACILTAALIFAAQPVRAASDEDAAADIGAVLTKAADFEACDSYRAAAETLSDALGRTGDDTSILVALAVVELKSGDIVSAEKHLDQAALAGATPEIMLWKALAKAAAGNQEAAGTLLGQGLEAAGRDEVKLYDLAEKFLRSGALSVAARIYEKVISIYPAESQFDIFAYLHLSTYYSLCGRDEKAVEIMNTARRPFEYSDIPIMTPNEADYLIAYFKGRAAAQAGKYQEAANILRDAAAVFPDGIVADAEAVRALKSAGKDPQADAAFALAADRLRANIASSPEDHTAYHNLALFMAAAARNPAEGLEACDWALRLSPLRPEYLDTQAVLLMQSGRFEDALVPVQRALVLMSAPRWADPGQYDSYVWHKLDILEKAGRPLPEAFRRPF